MSSYADTIKGDGSIPVTSLRSRLTSTCRGLKERFGAVPVTLTVRKKVQVVEEDYRKTTQSVSWSCLNELAVDPYVDHADIEATVKGRVNDGWRIREIMRCQPSKGRDYVTILWTPRYASSYTTTTKG